MKSRLRYLSALLINVALPWLVYRLAFPHWGQSGALAASALPLIAWMSWDLFHYRHFDALSALVLTGIVLSLGARSIGASTRLQSLEDPMVSGLIGISFLASLALRKPWVFYLARSTMSREDHRSAESFERHWRERPTLAAYIRLMTLVWGVGMIAENILRCAIVWYWPDDRRAVLASTLLRYGVYAALTLWTFWIRRRIKRDARRYPDDDAVVASSTVSL
ncbi:VC0807 family protein [Paraburkholderia sp. ZP32-5]|uniref:VC0807 family protein n=1 Tax=Paraburkholderia sp. ZP32-5 TaxID=2883245 RepID=UPI001F3F2B89|nr:VC0807 family protein [Paraburkholderia sp. ZP32-5]